jgi:predicted transcriptional regulator
MTRSGSVPTPAEGESIRTTARARAREVDELVAELARAILDRTYVPKQTIREMAEREGVKVATVEEWAAEAGRLVRIGPAVDEYRDINLRRLDAQYARATDAKEAVAAISEQNKMLGLHAPTVHKVDVSVQAYAKLDDAQMLEHVEAQLQRLTELRARLLAKKATAALPAVIDVEVEDESIEG